MSLKEQIEEKIKSQTDHLNQLVLGYGHYDTIVAVPHEGRKAVELEMLDFAAYVLGLLSEYDANSPSAVEATKHQKKTILDALKEVGGSNG
jgi:hypothetical protein